MSAYAAYGFTAPPGAAKGWTNPYYNPYARRVTLADGRDVNVAPDMSNLVAAVQWEDEQAARSRWGRPGATVAGVAPTVTGTGAGAGAAPVAAQGNPFSLLSNVKNQKLADINSGILAQIAGLTGNPGADANRMKATVKSPEMQGRINAAGARYDADVNNHAQSVADFIKAWMGGQAGADANAAQEGAAIGRVFDQGGGGVEAALQRLSRQREISIADQAQRAMGAATLAGNAGRLGQPNTSYLKSMLMGNLGQIASDAAREKVDRDREDLLGLVSLRSQLAGQRNALADAASQRRLLPLELGTQTSASDLAALGNLLGLNAANTDYEVTSPMRDLARILGLTGQAGGIDLANTFYGLQKPFEETNQNLVAPGRAPVGGFVNPYYQPRRRVPMDNPYEGPGYEPMGPGLPNEGPGAGPGPDMGAGENSPRGLAWNQLLRDNYPEAQSYLYDPVQSPRLAVSPWWAPRQAKANPWVYDDEGGMRNQETGEYRPPTTPIPFRA